MDTQTLITGAIYQFSAHALVVLAAVIGLGVGLLVFRWGWRKVTDIALDGMHSEWGTRTFRRLGPRAQFVWSSADRTWSRRRIMEME